MPELISQIHCRHWDLGGVTGDCGVRDGCSPRNTLQGISRNGTPAKDREATSLHAFIAINT
jgi:hypothetical protein